MKCTENKRMAVSIPLYWKWISVCVCIKVCVRKEKKRKWLCSDDDVITIRRVRDIRSTMRSPGLRSNKERTISLFFVLPSTSAGYKVLHKLKERKKNSKLGSHEMQRLQLLSSALLPVWCSVESKIREDDAQPLKKHRGRAGVVEMVNLKHLRIEQLRHKCQEVLKPCKERRII